MTEDFNPKQFLINFFAYLIFFAAVFAILYNWLKWLLFASVPLWQLLLLPIVLALLAALDTP